jgi:hypothetical protein
MAKTTQEFWSRTPFAPTDQRRWQELTQVTMSLLGFHLGFERFTVAHGGVASHGRCKRLGAQAPLDTTRRR